jgi:hypothetical protein
MIYDGQICARLGSHQIPQPVCLLNHGSSTFTYYQDVS